MHTEIGKGVKFGHGFAPLQMESLGRHCRGRQDQSSS
jgi:hypothetical protein